MPPFAPSPYSDDELLGVVGDVCRHASAESPIDTSQKTFNCGKAEAGHPVAPTAARICTRLNMGWVELKTASLDRKRNHVQTTAARTRTKNAPDLSKEACIFALRRVAKRRGVTELSTGSYDETADELRRESRRRWAHGDRLDIPTAWQIERCFGTFPAALKAAGLRVRRLVSEPREEESRMTASSANRTVICRSARLARYAMSQTSAPRLPTTDAARHHV